MNINEKQWKGVKIQLEFQWTVKEKKNISWKSKKKQGKSKNIRENNLGCNFLIVINKDLEGKWRGRSVHVREAGNENERATVRYGRRGRNEAWRWEEIRREREGVWEAVRRKEHRVCSLGGILMHACRSFVVNVHQVCWTLAGEGCLWIYVLPMVFVVLEVSLVDTVALRCLKISWSLTYNGFVDRRKV